VLGNGNNHAFDMHGGADRKDGTNLAGTRIEIYNNTFHKIIDSISGEQPSVVIRGVPAEGAWIHDNYLFYNTKEKNFVIQQLNALGNMSVYNNNFN